MVVELDSALTQVPSAAQTLEVLGLCAFGASKRHHIVPLDRPTWETWAKAWPRETEETLRDIWDRGEQKAALGAHDRVRVVPDPAGDPSARSPSTALTLLGYPLRVLVENGRHDRDFLLAFADTATREQLETAEARGWLVFESAGGIGEVEPRLKRIRDHAIERCRVFCMVDSDAKAPKQLSTKAKDARRLIGAVARAAGMSPNRCGHVLERRAAENYVPPREIRRSAAAVLGPQTADIKQAWDAAYQANAATLRGGIGRPGTPRRRFLAALALETIDERVIAHLDFDQGHGADGTRTDHVVWNLLRPLEKAVLKDGIGKDAIREVYRRGRGYPEATDELRELLGVIWGRL